MKKLFILSFAILAAGCAAGINTNVATIDGTTYLINTPTYIWPYGIHQYAKSPNFRALDNKEVTDALVRDRLAELNKECQEKAKKSRRYADVEIYGKCLHDFLDK